MNTRSMGIHGRLYQVHCANVRRIDTWLSLREVNHCLERVPRDYKEIMLFGYSEVASANGKNDTIPTSGEISLFIIGFL